MIKMCNFCGHKHFQRVVVQYIYRRDGKMLIVNDVPCEQCAFCGEQYFTAAVLGKIETDYRALCVLHKKPQKAIRVPVAQFA